MRDPLPPRGTSRDAGRSRVRTDIARRVRRGQISRILRDRAIRALARYSGECLGQPSLRGAEHDPSALPAASRRQDHDRGNRGGSGLRDLPAMVVDGDVHVVAFPCRKRNMAGRPVICPATLGNVNCLGRFVQPGGAAAYLLLYRLRNSNEPIRWASMRTSASSSGRSLMRM